MSTRHNPTTFNQLDTILEASDALLDALLTLIEESPSPDEALANRARVFKTAVDEINDWARWEASPHEMIRASKASPPACVEDISMGHYSAVDAGLFSAERQLGGWQLDAETNSAAIVLPPRQETSLLSLKLPQLRPSSRSFLRTW